MADLYVRSITTSRDRVGNGMQRLVTGTRDGAIYTADYIQGLAMEGRVFQAAVGSLTTPTSFRVGITTLQPELVIDVPTGTTIMPIEIQFYLETNGGTINEVVAMTGRALRGAGTSTAGTLLNTRTDAPVTSNCSFYYTYSGNAVAMSSALEFFRWGQPWVAATTEGNPILKDTWNIRTNTPQVLVGPASLSVYIGATSTAPTGFIYVTFAEVPSTGI